MIQRLRRITTGLYRGSAPSPKEVAWLKEYLGIRKIVSLDAEAGERISRACKLLGIKQEKVYINPYKPLGKLLKLDLMRLLIDGGPTYLHCLHGKDRTGLITAIFKCRYMGVSPEHALEEAKSLGFGLGLDSKVVKLYEKMIKNCKSLKDSNDADIVSNEREYIGDNRDSFLDEGHQGSFSPYLSVTKQNPQDAVYNFIMDQEPTRQNYHPGIKVHNSEEDDVVPQVGVYNNDAGVQGFGPTLNPGGFIYD